MRYYAVRPTNARALAACRKHGFGALLSPISVSGTGRVVEMDHIVDPKGLPHVLDNGAWSLHKGSIAGHDFAPFLRLLRRLGATARWAVLPDIVGGGRRSLELSLRWLARVADEVAQVLIPVQDGMEPADVQPWLGYSVGIFVGGSTAWKWQRLHDWAALALERRCTLHVGRVNGLRRATLCRDVGAQSCDGLTVSRFSVTARLVAEPSDGDASIWPSASPLPPLLSAWRGEGVARAEHAIAARRFEMTLGGAW